MMGKQRFSRIKSTADGVSHKYQMQDAVLSEQVKHAQKEALRRFIGQVLEQEYEDKKTAVEQRKMNVDFDTLKQKAVHERKVKELDVELGRAKQRNVKKQMLRTEIDYRRKVPDIEGHLGYPRIEHMTSS